MKHDQNDYVPVTGGVDLPKSYFRDDMVQLSGLTVDSDLDKHIVQLLALHPQLRVRFRNQDVACLDVQTKQALLADMNDALGIHPLSASQK